MSSILSRHSKLIVMHCKLNRKKDCEAAERLAQKFGLDVAFEPPRDALATTDCWRIDG